MSCTCFRLSAAACLLVFSPFVMSMQNSKAQQPDAKQEKRVLTATDNYAQTKRDTESKAPKKEPTLLWGYIDTSGKFVVEPKFETAHEMYDGLALVETGGRFGYINNKGNFVMAPEFECACDFIDGQAQVQVKGKWGFIDQTGKFVVQPTRTEFSLPSCSQAQPPLSDSELQRKQVAKKWGFINKEGKLIIPARFDNAFDFRNGVAPVAVVLNKRVQNKPTRK